jgi:RHS repeat-associated protein
MSPVNPAKTVGNSTQVRTPEKPATFAHGLMRSTFLSKTSQEEEGTPETPPTPQISPYISVWGSAFLLSNFQEDVTAYASTTNAWDYKNRLTWSYASSSPSVFYTYDDAMQRMTKWSGTSTTTTPNIYYTTTGATSTAVKSIFIPGGELVATIKGYGTGIASTTKEYTHADWLGSTNVTTSATGTVLSAISYYPYGSERVDTSTSTTDRHYIGQRFDTETSLNYFNNRYLSNIRGDFINEDPTFWGRQNLKDPQSLNSYSYANDNPIVNKDPDGLSSYSSLLGDPFGSEFFLQYLGGASAAAQLTGNPATAQLLAHSLSLNPGSIYAGNGSTLVNAITSNPIYQAKLQTALQGAAAKGLNSFNQTLPLNFNQGDAYTAFGKIDLNLTGTRNKDGGWQVSLSGSDVYNFTYNNYGGNKLVGSVNNLAYFGQGQGTVSNFTTYVNFSQTISPSQTFTTPSGAVVNWAGQLISGPPKKK